MRTEVAAKKTNSVTPVTKWSFTRTLFTSKAHAILNKRMFASTVERMQCWCWTCHISFTSILWWTSISFPPQPVSTCWVWLQLWARAGRCKPDRARTCYSAYELFWFVCCILCRLTRWTSSQHPETKPRIIFDLLDSFCDVLWDDVDNSTITHSRDAICKGPEAMIDCVARWKGFISSKSRKKWLSDSMII